MTLISRVNTHITAALSIIIVALACSDQELVPYASFIAEPTTTISSIRQSQSVDSPAPVAQYRFDELQGDVLFDHSGNDHHGTLIGNVVRGVPGIGKVAMLFGTDVALSYARIPSHPDFSVGEDGMTIEAVVAPSTFSFVGTPAVLCTGFPRADYISFANKHGQIGVNGSPPAEWLLRMYPSEAVGGPGCKSRAERISAYIFNPGGGLGSGSYNQPGPRTAGVYITVRAAYDPPSIAAPRVHLWVNGVKSPASPADLYSHYNVVPSPGDADTVLGAGILDSVPVQFRGAFDSFTVWRGVIAP